MREEAETLPMDCERVVWATWGKVALKFWINSSFGFRELVLRSTSGQVRSGQARSDQVMYTVSEGTCERTGRRKAAVRGKVRADVPIAEHR